MATEIKSSGVGVVLSFFWTGLGQLYAGRIKRGLVMMLSTPVIWAISMFSGGMGVLGGLATLGATQGGTHADVAGAGSVGILGFLFMLSALAWWIWGMIDAKKICEQHNTASG